MRRKTVEHPLVSVLVTVYNQGKYVREALESVVGQTYPDWEMIVTDDQSPDDSWEEIQKVDDKRIRRILRPTNSGLANIPRNEMIRAAKGKYLAFLDGDDVWMPDKLKIQVEYMEEHPEYPCSHVACMVVDGQGRDLYLRNWGNYPQAGDCFAELMKKCFICTSSVMVRRDFAREIGGFSEEKRLRNNGDDTEFFLRCARGHGIGFPGPLPLVRYRWTDTSLTHHPKHWKPGLDLMKRRDLWEGRLTEREVRDIVWQNRKDAGYEMRKNGRWGPAMWYAGQMIRLKWWNMAGWKMLGAAVLRRS